MNIEQKLYDTAVDLIKKRYPTGWGGAAAMYTEDGRILTSVAPEVINASTELCIETPFSKPISIRQKLRTLFVLRETMNIPNARY